MHKLLFENKKKEKFLFKKIYVGRFLVFFITTL